MVFGCDWDCAETRRGPELFHGKVSFAGGRRHQHARQAVSAAVGEFPVGGG
jgi:hypothetical protein